MYVFRIVNVIDRSKAWYKGEVFAANINVSATNPPIYVTGGYDIGDTQEVAGYIYTSLQDDNIYAPATNYVGYPGETTETVGNNAWIRSGYANKTKMLTPESGGITESYNNGMSGVLSPPEGDLPTSLFNALESCTCCLFHGVLGANLTINGAGIDLGWWSRFYKHPELAEETKTVTVNTEATYQFIWGITRPGSGIGVISTYCSGAYLGSWSYIGKTQWTDHKKTLNDYSKQEQDEWGNYSLSKRRAGRTYSAEVMLSTRDTAVEGDYDYDLTSLCFSVTQLLRSLMGKPAAFYFNNQDISCKTAYHNVFRNGVPIMLTSTDLIVGILQNFEITDLRGKYALLKMSVNSVPTEYQNYDTSIKNAPSIAPALPDEIELPACTDVTFVNMITDEEITAGSSLNVSLNILAWTNVLSIVPEPANASIFVLYLKTWSYGTISIEVIPDEENPELYTLSVNSTGKGDAAFEWQVINDTGSSKKKILQLRGLESGIGSKKHFVEIQVGKWDATKNTYGYAKYFYLENLGTTVIV